MIPVDWRDITPKLPKTSKTNTSKGMTPTVLHSTHAWKNAPFPIGLPWECEEGVCVVERSMGPSQRWGSWPSSACSLPLQSSFPLPFLCTRPRDKQRSRRSQDGNGNAISETTRSVDENTAVVSATSATPVTATDADTDDNDRLVYTLENAHSSSFTIVRATGQLQVGLPLDYERKNNLLQRR